MWETCSRRVKGNPDYGMRKSEVGEENPKNMTLLKGEQLTKKYPGDVTAIEGVTVEIAERDIAVILGPSGSGKTTLLNLFATLDAPSEGRVFLREQEITGLPEAAAARLRNRHFGFIFQFFHLLPELTVLENVMLPLRIRDANPLRMTAHRKKAEQLLNEFHLDRRENFHPAQLSGGELQRTAICRSLICDPEIIFADEPTGSIDSESARILFENISRLNRERNVTFLIATHNEKFLQLATHVVYLREGHTEER